MPKIVLILLTLVSFKSISSELKNGDVLLQPLACWSCSLIEAQENSIFSHIGVYLRINNQDMVAEAYGKVKLVTLSEFLAKTEKNQKVLVRRHVDFEKLGEQFNQKVMSYIGNPYDSMFLWDNYIKDKEAIYCSELLYKAMKPFVRFNDLGPTSMPFDINPEYWDRFFRGKTPRGKVGISPEDFNLSNDFYTIMEI